jgi:V-type H+-transporting ATPase subunit H
LDKKIYGKKQREFLLLLNSLVEAHKAERLFNPRISELTFVICIANLIKHEHICVEFIKTSGISLLHDFFVKGSNELQLMYYSILTLWLLSFSEDSIPIFSNPKHGFIRLTMEIIQKISREKLVRVAFCFFKNLVDKSQACTELMVDLGLLKIVDTLIRGNI